jgi:tectonic-1/3
LFHSQDVSQASIPNGNLVPRVRSGNPGYYLGAPVLFGYLDATVSSTVKEVISGMTIPSPLVNYDATAPVNFGKAKCPTSTQTQASMPVKFGYDVATGCTVTLTREQLIDMCCAGSTSCATTRTSSYIDSSTGIPYFLLPLVSGYVGIFGNADPLDATQWEAFTTTVVSQPRLWNDATNTCQNMRTGTDYSFLVAFAGERANPQNKIVAATANVITSNWVWTHPYGDSNSTQTFPLTVTASFIVKDPSSLEGYSPPAPPVLFKVPYDVFYPFLESPAPPSKSVSLAATSLTIGACLFAVSGVFSRFGFV